MEDEQLVEKYFYERFKGYDMPLEPLKIPDTEKQGYFLRAKDLSQSDVLRKEIAEVKRKLYFELALRAKTDMERQGYRQSLIAIADLEKRLLSLGDLYSAKPLRALQDKL